MASTKIVLANGVFDIFHYGHLLYLEAAAKMGTQLVVAVTRDKYVNKGPHRPMFGEKERAKIVRAIRCVDGVMLCDDSLDALQMVDPDIFAKGADYIGRIEQKHADFCKARGIRIAFTKTPIYSATKIINDRFRQS